MTVMDNLHKKGLLHRQLPAFAVAVPTSVVGHVAAHRSPVAPRQTRPRPRRARVDHDERPACCLPGRNGHAVITTGALRSLAGRPSLPFLPGYYDG
ncbi:MULTISPECIES: hypothetical protein [unclassified Nonomuraea]|uniref:hypothetical protein n=1 Tax=unclassified Nonomuraea TaxID=2593643 RepID=UPI0035BF5C15